ncbi:MULTISPECIES: DNA-3-methyladenine glycosylase [Paenibacillus]|uniref:Putative 3-methyladenine DNA glycosylase n=1 Tax=Paenibacillus albilobatus TaxID=2716884 RepID=A0A919XLA8_9BACL|nr:MULTISPECIES: DNA-3-methyladenine glycosylase [Paenibacillus]GIO35076.1 DNA-3-methyladenine glycosylase [Paenibacillus albilobatus]
MHNSRLISPSLLGRTALEAAPLLLGQTLVRVTEDGEVRCRIVETESYGGAEDRGSHAFGNRRTARTEVMFAAGGVAYVYLIYGMYSCLNVVVGDPDDPQAVLIRAVEPLSDKDAELMLAYRGEFSGKKANLCNGPGKLCRALRIDRSLNGYPLNRGDGMLRLEAGDPVDELPIVQCPRINIDYAGEYALKPWRYYIEGNPYVSVKDKQPTPWKQA